MSQMLRVLVPSFQWAFRVDLLDMEVEMYCRRCGLRRPSDSVSDVLAANPLFAQSEKLPNFHSVLLALMAKWPE